MKDLLKIFYKILIFIFSCYAMAHAATEGVLELDIKGKGFSNGDIVDSRLTLSPWAGKKNDGFIKKYAGKTFLEYFYVTDVVSAEIVGDVFTSDLRMAIKKSFKGQESAQFSIDGEEVSIRIIKNQFMVETENIEKFILFEQFEEKDRMIYYILISILAISGIIIFWQGFLFYKKRKQKIKEIQDARDERSRLIHLMKNVKEKKDIQKIYAKREQLEKIFSNSHRFRDILKMINEHQYKNNLPENIILEIREKLIWNLERQNLS